MLICVILYILSYLFIYFSVNTLFYFIFLVVTYFILSYLILFPQSHGWCQGLGCTWSYGMHFCSLVSVLPVYSPSVTWARIHLLLTNNFTFSISHLLKLNWYHGSLRYQWVQFDAQPLQQDLPKFWWPF